MMASKEAYAMTMMESKEAYAMTMTKVISVIGSQK